MRKKYPTITMRDTYLHTRRTDGCRTCPQVFKRKDKYDRKAIKQADQNRFRKGEE